MNKRGFALIFTFFVIVVVMFTGAIILSRIISEGVIAQKYTESTQAFWLTEAGVNRAFWEFNLGDGNWSEWDDDSGDKSLLASLGEGEYYVEVTDPTALPSTITATGYIPSQSNSRIERVIEAEVNLKPIFTYAIFGKTSVTMSGNAETDSYNSSQGPYGGGNKGSNGDVGTNGTTEGAISLSGNATVNGDASTGEGGTVETSGNAEVTGEITDDCDEDLPSVEVPSELEELESEGSLTVGGNNEETITEGDYKYTSISVSGNGELTIEGTVNLYLTSTSDAFKVSGNGEVIIDSDAKLTIYTDGKFNLSGNGIANTSEVPENFLLYSTYSGSGDGVKITGNSDLYGAIYAPDTNIKLPGNGDIYGSAMGEEISVSGNGEIHYDEALTSISEEFAGYVIKTWQEEQKPYPVIP